MSRNYKFNNKEGLYFVSFATINWIDVFVWDEYFMAFSAAWPGAAKKKAWQYIRGA